VNTVADKSEAHDGGGSGGYRTALVTYIDLLGFSDLIQDSRANPSTVQKVLAIAKIVKEEFSAGGRVHRDAEGRKERIFSSFNFSDLTVRCTVMPDGSNVGDFVNWELFYVGEKQLALAQQGVLVRGGLCIDQIFVDNEAKIVFGPALVKAYKLESEFAVYPRIVVDRDVIWATERPDSTLLWREYVQQGEDGAHFLDYLFGTFMRDHDFRDRSEFDPTACLAAHRDMIESFIEHEIPKKSERTKQKYSWLARYHNNAIKRIRERFSATGSSVNFDQFSISSGALRF
jgi:hypothetical protein